MVEGFFAQGWCVLPYETAVAEWASEAWQHGQTKLTDPHWQHSWTCEDTWFVGVDALDTDRFGALSGGTNLPGSASTAIQALYGAVPALHKAQMSVVRPGYPRPRDAESAAAFRYRLQRDAAHVDGLIKGSDGGRYLREPHEWIMGIPLTKNQPHHAPLVVWPGSHRLMGAVFARALAGHQPDTWRRIDLSAVYKETRKLVFESCPRVPLTPEPGQLVILHRHLLHGIAPWQSPETDHKDATELVRAIAYFRPCFAGTGTEWISRA